MKLKTITALFLVLTLLASCESTPSVQKTEELVFLNVPESQETIQPETGGDTITIDEIPEYSGDGVIEISSNVPAFEVEELTEMTFVEFGNLDELGRCTYALMCAGPETLPTSKRGDISSVHPTGWKQNFYPFVEQEALYNRSHLLAYSLSGENANDKNLITGTRYMNATLMEPFESEIADYIKTTGNHVIYEVTPVFEGDNLLASGVEMQAYSVEDDGEGISFHVYCYNVQPGVEIDYKTGKNWEADVPGEKETFILNTYTRTFHEPDCHNADHIKKRDYQEYYGTEEILLEQGYEPDHSCVNESR